MLIGRPRDYLTALTDDVLREMYLAGIPCEPLTTAWLLGALQQNRHIRTLPDGWNATASAIVVLAVMLAYTRMAPRRALLLALGMAGAALLLS